jgi:anti-sigma factor ChrR (cupin superfamily)
MHVFVMNELRNTRSSAARSKLEAMEAEVAHIIEAEERMQAARDEAVALYDSLSAEEQQRVQDEKLWVIKYELDRRNSPFRTGLL